MMSDGILPVWCDARQRAAEFPAFSRQLSGPNALPCLSDQYWPAREERTIGGETIGAFTILTAVAEHG
jgi:hypothetical protein